MTGGPGPVALVGSGEFLPVMEPVDAGLLEGRARRAVVAAHRGRTGRRRPRRRTGSSSGARTTRPWGSSPSCSTCARATRPTTPTTAAAGRRGRGSSTCRAATPTIWSRRCADTALWHAIVAAWQAGAALAGCSAGAMALTAGAPDNLVPPGGAPRRRAGAPPGRQRAGPDRGPGRHPPLRPDGAVPARGARMVRLVATGRDDAGGHRGGDGPGGRRPGGGEVQGARVGVGPRTAASRARFHRR